MNSILWTQGIKSADNSTFVINDKVYYSDGQEIAEAYHKLIKMSKRPALHRLTTKAFKSVSLIKASQFKMTYKKDEGIYFQSVYSSLDEDGRHVAFMFFCETNDIERACQTFKKYSKMARRNVEEIEIKSLKHLFRWNKYVAVATALLGFITLWKIIN